MKTLLSLLIAFSAQGAPHHHTDHPALHGMAVVGTEKIYLSHLPMFHSPHDYQVLLEVEFDEATKVAYKDNKAAFSETVYTIAPEVFVLPEMAQAGKTFQALLFRGHFERGGAQLTSQALVKIKQVLFFKKFNPAEPKPVEAHFLLFGNEKEQFLAHGISAKPDFDQLLSVKVSKGLAAVDGVISLVLPGFCNETALTAPEKVWAVEVESGNEIDLEVLQSLYLETGDLSF